MHLSNKAAKIIFASAAVVLLLIAAILYGQIKDLLFAQEQLNETNLVKLKLAETLSALKDAETAQRGFLLTRDSLFLQPYRGAYDRSKTLLLELKAHTVQQKELDALATLIEVRFKTFNHVIEQYNNPHINDQTRKGHLLRGNSSYDSIASYARKIEAGEDALVKEREQRKAKYTFLTPFFAILLMVVSIGVLLFSYLKVTEHLNRSQRLLRKLRKLNHRLKSKNHQLELYNKELDSFTYIASHDLKEPLRKILTYTEMIENTERQHLSVQAAGYFQKIERSTLRMRNLINDLLQYAQVNMTERKYEETDLNKLLQDVLINLSEEITESNACLKAGNLPKVRCMPFQIRQLFENLISNSIQYRQEGIAPAICISCTLIDKSEIDGRFHKNSNRYYKLTLSDNGLGFDQSYAEKVFQLFQRLHTTSNLPGTGIGLTICKKIVENHHGFIRAKSEVNKGTTFDIYLPVT